MEVIPVNTYEEYRNIIKGKKLINNSFLPNDIKKINYRKDFFICKLKKGNFYFMTKIIISN